jgi:hypothetical protein
LHLPIFTACILLNQNIGYAPVLSALMVELVDALDSKSIQNPFEEGKKWSE